MGRRGFSRVRWGMVGSVVWPSSMAWVGARHGDMRRCIGGRCVAILRV